MDNIRCEKCDKEFASEEALNMHNKAKHAELSKEPKKILTEQQKKKIRNWFIFVLVMVVIVGGAVYMFLNIKTLPPIDIQGHIESSPISHVVKEPMSIAVQKHMLEHADGEGLPGIVINYNCKDYQCGGDLIPKLEAFAEKYPSNVYVAPFANMDAKIALTRLGRIEVLEDYDEDKINRFILR